MRAHKLIPLIAAATLLAGCAASTSTAPEAVPVATAADKCLELNSASIDALNAGITDPAVKLGQYAAVPSPEGTDLWYVAATYTADDLSGEAVWITQYDPTNSDDNAYLSVDAVAETISSYNRLEGADITAPGAVEATNCLEE